MTNSTIVVYGVDRASMFAARMRCATSQPLALLVATRARGHNTQPRPTPTTATLTKGVAPPQPPSNTVVPPSDDRYASPKNPVSATLYCVHQTPPQHLNSSCIEWHCRLMQSSQPLARSMTTIGHHYHWTAAHNSHRCTKQHRHHPSQCCYDGRLPTIAHRWERVAHYPM